MKRKGSIMARIFIIMGKSSTGKDTIFKRLIEAEKIKLKTVVSYTTRPIRQGETDGVEYFFVDKDRMKELQDANKIIEHRAYNTVHGIWYYFTADDGQIDLDVSDYVMIGTLESFKQMKEYYGENVYPIYIEVEDGVRLRRALNREQKQEVPKYAELCRRYLADEEDFSETNIKELGIEKRYNNLDINICLQQIIDDITRL